MAGGATCRLQTMYFTTTHRGSHTAPHHGTLTRVHVPTPIDSAHGMQTHVTAGSITPLGASAGGNEAAVYIDDASPAFVAALQSTLLNDIPVLGVHTLWLDDAPKYVHGDVLALRAAQCGWTTVHADGAPVSAWDDAADVSHDPSTAYAHAVAHGSFDFVAGPQCGYELRAEHIAWDTPRVVPTHPDAVLAALPPGARMAGEVVLAWGTARHGPAWRAVPRVSWTSHAQLTWLRDPCDVPQALLDALQDVLLDDTEDVVAGAVVGQAQSVLANAGLQELVERPEWRGVLRYDAHAPQCHTTHAMSVTTNGQLPAMAAVVTALRIMAADARTIVERCV